MARFQDGGSGGLPNKRWLAVVWLALLVQGSSSGAAEEPACPVDAEAEARSARRDHCFVDATGQVEYCLPQVLGVCCVSAGSTSLAHYLNALPSLSFGDRKEHTFFRFRGGRPYDLEGRNSKQGRQMHAATAVPGLATAAQQRALVPTLLHDGSWTTARVNYTSVTWAALRALRFVDDQPDTQPFFSPLRQGRPGMPWATSAAEENHQGSDAWQAYARQFPARVEAPRDDSARASGDLIRFDFDPTYFGTVWSAASARAIVRTFSRGPSAGLVVGGPKLLFVLRDPAVQACGKDKLTGRGGDDAAAGRCWDAARRVRAVEPADGGGGGGSSSTTTTTNSDSNNNASTGRGGEGGGVGGWRWSTYAEVAPRFAQLHESQACPTSWVLQQSSYCYAEHLEEWVRLGFTLERMHFVKSEELWDRTTRRAVVEQAARFMGAPANESVPTDLLDADHNVSPHRKPRSTACYDALTTNVSFLTMCNHRLATLLQDPKWEWW